jgi:hypothetical protein
VKVYLAVFSGILLLVAGFMSRNAELGARRYFPLQFSDELSSRYYMIYVHFNRTIPLEIRRRIAVSTALSLVAFLGFSATAWLFGNPVIALLLLLICGYGGANIIWQWRSAKRSGY